MRPITETYWKLIERFASNPSGDYEFFVLPEGSETVRVSLAHAACLSYLVWRHQQDIDSLGQFAEVGKEWRKGHDLLSKPRPFVMKKVAVLCRKLRELEMLEKKAEGGRKGTRTQLKKKIGVHSDDYPMEQHVANGRKGQALQMARKRPPRTNHWEIIDPYGRKFTIFNMNEFCRKRGLISGHMYGVARGLREHHKGYRCRKISPETFNEKRKR